MKIVVWNIEKFTNTKFEEYEYNPKVGIGSKRKAQYLDSQKRVDYMGRVVSAGNAFAPPDVIAVVETLVDRDTQMGQPMGELESAGVLRLLKLIKDETGNPNWRIVPPIKCNPSKGDGVKKWAQEEAVAVFYNSAAVTFEGPDYWNGNAIQRGAGGETTYPKPWKLATRTGATTRAGRIAHTDKAGQPVLFPKDMNRRPFMVDFKETGFGGRLFRCLFIHTSPQRGPTATSVTGTANIAKIADMNPKDNTTENPDYYIACGDFNVNMYETTAPAAAYTPLTKLRYKAVLLANNTDSTHFYRNSDAFPMQPFWYHQTEIIDNFFVLKNSKSQPAITTYTSLSINAVDGVPWGTAMDQDLQTINAIVFGPNQPGPTATFRQWENFRCIISTSDHLPIYLDIP